MAYNPQNPNGQKIMDNSAPVVIASDQTAVPVSGTFFQATQPVSIASSVPVILTAATTGGLSLASGASDANGLYKTIKGSAAGQVYGWYFYNPNTAAAYVRFYDLAGGNIGSNPTYILPIPPVSGANAFGLGITHANGIHIAITQSRADSTGMLINVDYTVFYK
jgi:hypothetical protein